MCTTPFLEWSHESYAGTDLCNPDVFPIYATLGEMPPALFAAGILDPLLDDSLFMYARWVAAGNQTELNVYPGTCHGFNLFPLMAAKQANRYIEDFIHRSVGSAP